MPRLIFQPGVADWREVPTPDGLGTELKAFDHEGNPADWAVQPGSQEDFINCPIFELLYAGNRGGGKTACLLMDFAQHVDQGFGAAWKGILFRQSYPDLKDVVDKAKAIFPLIWPDSSFNEQKMTWKWATGEQLVFAHMKHESDYNKYHGHAYPWIGWEELTTWADPTCYLRMFSCCRSSSSAIDKRGCPMPRKVRATTNPYGPGFNWVKERFRLPLPPGHVIGDVILDEKTGTERVCIYSDLAENKVMLKQDPDYVNRLKTSAKNAAELAAWLHGSWDITSGGMFDDIWMRVRERCVLQPFQVPESWRIDRSFDWGSSKPFSVGWWAESDGTDLRLPDGRMMRTVKGDVFRIQEWYGWNGEPNKGCKMLAKDIAKGIIEREMKWGIHGRVRRGIADAAIFDEQNGNSIARDMEAPVDIDGTKHRGVYFDPADKRSGSRKQGWEQVRDMLASVLPERPGQPRERPGLFVVSTCIHFLRTVPTLPRDDDDLDDVNTKAEDHVADEVRYRCRKETRTAKGGRTSGLR
jgi:hypothetical protein